MASAFFFGRKCRELYKGFKQHPLKIIYFTKYSRQGASSRLRSYQYIPFLEKEGFSVTVKPLFGDDYLDALYHKKSGKAIITLKSYLKRLFQLFTILSFDIVIIEKELFPYFFSWFERIFKLLGVRYIADYDDAIFHNYDLNENKLIRFFLKNKIDNVMRNSYYIIAGNSYLAARAQKSGAENIIILATVINTKRYIPKENYKSREVVIGWIGSPTTFRYVEKTLPILQNLQKKYPIKINIIGGKSEKAIPGVNYLKWEEDKENEYIRKFDIGIMPLDETPWELGKCAYKLIQYMGCGVPVVASPIGMNNEVVKNNENGFLAKTDEQWLSSLEQLIINQRMREDFGKKGRLWVEEKYNLEINVKKLINLLKK